MKSVESAPPVRHGRGLGLLRRPTGGLSPLWSVENVGTLLPVLTYVAEVSLWQRSERRYVSNPPNSPRSPRALFSFLFYFMSPIGDFFFFWCSLRSVFKKEPLFAQLSFSFLKTGVRLSLSRGQSSPYKERENESFAPSRRRRRTFGVVSRPFPQSSCPSAKADPHPGAHQGNFLSGHPDPLDAAGTNTTPSPRPCRFRCASLRLDKTNVFFAVRQRRNTTAYICTPNGVFSEPVRHTPHPHGTETDTKKAASSSRQPENS